MKLHPFLLGFFLTLPAWALPSLVPAPQPQTIQLGLSSSKYLTETKETRSEEKIGNLAVSLAANGQKKWDGFHIGGDAEILYGLKRSNYKYIDIAEAYAGYDRQSHYFYLGRKRFEWNELDSYWSLGLFNPRFRWDYLHEKESGLFGAFLGGATETFQATAFFSPIFIPEQGAPFEFSDGACKTSSPWFNCPSSSISLFNQPTNVYFSLDVPPIRELISHWGTGATIRVGKNLGPFARASYAYKAINQLALSYEGRLDLSTLQIPAVIRPRVLYHTLYAFDLGWNLPKHSLVATQIWEKPKRDNPPSHWNTQEFYNAALTGVTLKSAPLKSMRHTRVEFSYFHRHGGNGDERGPFSQRGREIFEPRYAFKNAYSAALFTPISDQWADRFLFATKFVLDTYAQGNLLQTDVVYKPISRVSLNIGVDLLGSETRSPVDFISRYQRNDRIRGGVSYVF